MGAGLLEESEYRRMAQELETRARGGESPARAARPKSIDELKALHGIEVIGGE